MKTLVLLVEDDPDITVILSDRLKAMGYDVIAASDGEMALDAMAKNSPGLLLLDIELPRMSGLDVLRRVHQISPEIPVIVMTAHGTIARAVEAMKEGAVDFITKPIEPANLRSVIAKALERKDLSSEVVRLLGDINHDIKNLLTPVVSGAGILETEIEEVFEKLPEMEAVKSEASHQVCNEVIEMLRDAARRIQDRTKEIADYVKGISVPPRFAPCLIINVVDSVFKTLRLLADTRGLALKHEGLEDLPSIFADDRRLYNAFYNLVNNAITETPAGGAITIRGALQPDTKVVVLSVTDTGCGMSDEVRQSLFTSQTISRNAGGTGLGTKIVKDVVDAHGGRITVDSKKGFGTAFSIQLPVEGLVAADCR